MKTNKLFSLVALLLGVLTFNSCDEELEKFKTADGALLSYRETTFDLSIPTEDLTLTIPVSISTPSSEARTFNAIIVSATEGTASEYTVGTISVPANEYSGTLTIDFDFSQISGDDGVVKQLVVGIDAPAGITTYNDIATINYFREIICNDLELRIVSDVWASETYFSLRALDDSGNVTSTIVERFFPFGGNSLTPQEVEFDVPLPDGNYRYEMGDTFGDGMEGSFGDVTLIGEYALTCSIITHASGAGTFDSAVPDPGATGNNPIVEITDFTVNP